MLFISGHGRNAQPGPLSPEQQKRGEVSAEAACGFDQGGHPNIKEATFGNFDYFFPSAPDVPHSETMTGDLDRLADLMIDQAPQEVDNSEIPALFTYIGQFIDHDITAGTDRETAFSSVDIPDVSPKPRRDVAWNVANLRTGALDLDSLYGGAVLKGPFAERFEKALRFPEDKALLFLGVADGENEHGLPGPDDPARDLLRLDWALNRSEPVLTKADFDKLPDELNNTFFDEKGDFQRSRAIIADGRNDENLGIAQFHVSMARFHNKIAIGSGGSTEERYNHARQQTRWHHQWLVVNEYLNQVCDPKIVSQTLKEGAPVYGAFLSRMKAHGYGGKLPIPLEFSVAAFRFGHTMARPDYDWNAVFGREVEGVTHFLPRSDFRFLFKFTGNPQFERDAAGLVIRSPSELDATNHRIPRIWIADMKRLMNHGVEHSDRNTRLVDTQLAPPLLDMIANAEGMHNALRHLARRNLRRGQRLNIPSGQSCIEGLAANGVSIASLSAKELQSGSTGAAVTDALATETPLWFYVLKEAELLAEGKHLGPLGSRLVAETLIGLVANEPASYWKVAGSDDGRWHPRDGAQPGGKPVDSYQALLEAAGTW